MIRKCVRSRAIQQMRQLAPAVSGASAERAGQRCPLAVLCQILPQLAQPTPTQKSADAPVFKPMRAGPLCFVASREWKQGRDNPRFLSGTMESYSGVKHRVHLPAGLTLNGVRSQQSCRNYDAVWGMGYRPGTTDTRGTRGARKDLGFRTLSADRGHLSRSWS